MRNPILLVAAALAGGIFAARWIYFSERESLIYAGALLLAAALCARLRRFAAAVVLSLLGTALGGAFFIHHWPHAHPRDDVESLIAAGHVDVAEPVRVNGWIAAAELRRGQDEFFLLRLERIESLQRSWPVSGTISLQHFRYDQSEPALNLRYGERVAALVRLRPVRGFHNEGSFDREGRARREGVLYYASIKAAELAERLPGRGGSRFLGSLHALRAALLERLDALFPPERPANGLLRAMLLGDRSGLDRRVSDDFQKTGTYHVLVVSGLNAVAVGAPFLWLLLRLRVPQLVATLAAIAALALYVFMAGMNVPIQRSAVMFSIYLLARLVYRERALLNTIAVSALLLLAIQPADLNDGGFQLSFFAVLLIAALAVPVVEKTSAPYRRALEDLDNTDRELLMGPAQAQFRLDLRMLRDALRDTVPAWLLLGGVRALFRTYELLVVAAVVQVGFLLPMALYFHRAALVSIPANMIIVPLVGIAVTLGMAMLMLALVSHTVAGLLAIPLAALLEMVMAAARWHAALGLSAVRVPLPPSWVSWLFVAAATALAAALLAQPSRWTRRSAALAAAALCFTAVLIISYPFSPKLPREEMEITALDVAQGDAIVVLAPPGRVMLVDTGGLAGGEWATDTGEQIVSPFLWARGIRRINVVALTHGHHDHIAGLAAILENFRVQELWLPAIPDLEPYGRLARQAQQHGVALRLIEAGSSASFGDAAIQFLAPLASYKPARRAGNNDSFVMRLQYGERVALLPGDIEGRIEKQLLGAGAPLHADWLKAPHHGSKTSNSQEFLNEVRAPFAVISVAANSPFGHPHAEALERLQAAGTRVLRTDREGAITWATDGHRVRVNTYEWQRLRAPLELW